MLKRLTVKEAAPVVALGDGEGDGPVVGEGEGEGEPPGVGDGVGTGVPVGEPPQGGKSEPNAFLQEVTLDGAHKLRRAGSRQPSSIAAAQTVAMLSQTEAQIGCEEIGASMQGTQRAEQEKSLRAFWQVGEKEEVQLAEVALQAVGVVLIVTQPASEEAVT